MWYLDDFAKKVHKCLTKGIGYNLIEQRGVELNSVELCAANELPLMKWAVRIYIYFFSLFKISPGLVSKVR